MKRVGIVITAICILALGCLASPAWAQRACTPTLNTCPSQAITTSTIQLGGAGSLSSNGPSFSNPGRLDDGTIAEADLEFTFDRNTGLLTLVARNQTSTVASLTGFGFNTTADVTGMTLVSETGSLAWEMAFDRDRNDNVVDTHPSLQELRLDGFGRFNVVIANKGIDTGPAGGDRREILAGQSVTFVIQVTGNISNLTACSFTSQPSLIPPGDKIVTAVGRFQAGQQGGSGFIGPCTGGSLLVTMASVDVVPGNGAVEITWQTAAEIENAGFAVLRRDVRTGRVVRLTSTLIPAQGSEVSGASYAFTDKTAVNGRKYEYMVEDWDIRDINTIHRPVTAVPNPTNPPIRLKGPAYEALAAVGSKLRWEGAGRTPVTVEISRDGSFSAEGTVKLPVGARSSRGLSPADIAQIVRMAAASGEGGAYWRVTARSQGTAMASQTYFLRLGR